MGLQYFITTLSTAFSKILPIIGYLAIGYFLCIKLPFLLILKVKKENENSTAGEEEKVEAPQILGDVKNNSKREEKKSSSNDQKMKTEQKSRGPKAKSFKQDKAHTDKKKQNRQEFPKPHLILAEEIFELTPGQTLSKSELKKKYHELLKKHHPDKVDTLGSDFKELAEKKTKDINLAYQKLKSKVS